MGSRCLDVLGAVGAVAVLQVEVQVFVDGDEEFLADFLPVELGEVEAVAGRDSGGFLLPEVVLQQGFEVGNRKGCDGCRVFDNHDANHNKVNENTTGCAYYAD